MWAKKSLTKFLDKHFVQMVVIMGGASLARLVGQKVILADGFCVITMKIGLLVS